MFATTSSPRVRGPVLILGVVCLLAAAGIPRLVLDPAASFRLDGDDEVVRADRALRSTTGGDDLVALVVWDQRGPLRLDSLKLIDDALMALANEPALLRSRSVTRAPILSSTGGTLTAETPLHPLPAEAALEIALSRVLDDPFVSGALVTPDGTMAVVPSWIRRDSREATLVQVAAKALAREEVRQTEEGKACKQAVDEARLAVVLGDAEGPADAEVSRRLRLLGHGGNSLAERFVSDADALVANPEWSALEAVRAVRSTLELPSGVTAEVLGEASLQAELSSRFPFAIVALTVGSFLGIALAGAGRSRRMAALLSAGAGATFVAGGMGWAGAPLHAFTALCIPVGALVGGAAAGAGLSVRATLVGLLPILGLALATSSVEGVLPGLLLVSVVGAAATRIDRPMSKQMEEPEERPLWLSLVLVLVGAAVTAVHPLGVDPSHLLDARTATGEVMAALDAHGMATPAQIALDGGKSRSLATPEALLELAEAQSSLEAQPAVLATTSWADFIQMLHGTVSGEDGLPTDPALVEQYLLLFGRPDDVRPLVATDFSVGGGFLRLQPGLGASLGPLSGPVGNGRVVVTGGAARVSRSGWLTARTAALGAGAGLLLALLLSWVGGQGRAPGSLAFSLAGCVVAVAGAAAWSGAVGFEAALAGSTVWFLATLGGRRPVLAGLGAGLVLVSPVVSVTSYGLGVAGGCVALWFTQGTRDR